MARVLGIVCALGICVAGLPAQSQTQSIAWADLVDPAAQVFEDPYRDLTYDQLDRLRTLVRARARLDQPTLTQTERFDAEETEKRAAAQLAEEGIDADWLIDQRWEVAERRKTAAVAGNPDVDGAEVVLSGFAIAAPDAEDGTSVVYLVPERGMCSHMPPPNANQMVRARLGSDWQPSYIHEPVRLTGQLRIANSEHAFNVVDGQVQMRASFVMEVDRIETLEDMRTASEGSTEWAKQIAANLKAARQNTQGGKTAE